jgi:acyl carrier protein
MHIIVGEVITMRNRKEIEHIVCAAIYRHVELDESKYTLDDTFDSLNLDSLDVAQVVMFVEDRLNINMKIKDFGKIKTINDAIDVVDQWVNKADNESSTNNIVKT